MALFEPEKRLGNIGFVVLLLDFVRSAETKFTIDLVLQVFRKDVVILDKQNVFEEKTQ